MIGNSKGFTLVELLVVITIMGIIGAFVVANYRSFGENQSLKSDVLNIQNIFRQAQTDASTNAQCDNTGSTGYSATWQLDFYPGFVYLKCKRPASQPTLKKTLTLADGIEIQSSSGGLCPISSDSFAGLTIKFAPLTGKIDFFNFNGDEFPECKELTIGLVNHKTENTQYLIIEKGGRVYGE
ncbi:prepilin-type N-terminal cleavage/methylation domain-containing protein [Candidatus Daviesbacteria bacterium]|nr:prepilin-type N-terminal cleavage/methylation domain-containing protein [Candidatus Daviesbacteria bacterium]